MFYELTDIAWLIVSCATSFCGIVAVIVLSIGYLRGK